MKILYYWANTSAPMFEWQRVHIFNELERHGVYFEIMEMNNKQTMKLFMIE